MQSKFELFANTIDVPKYVIGVIYKDKGEYLGMSKGAHKFLHNPKPFYQRHQNFGVKYHFEKA